MTWEKVISGRHGYPGILELAEFGQGELGALDVLVSLSWRILDLLGFGKIS